MCRGEEIPDREIKGFGQKKGMRRVRPAVESDLDQMAAIEAVSIPDGWSRKAFSDALKNDQALLMVLTQGEASGDLVLAKERSSGDLALAKERSSGDFPAGQEEIVLAYLLCYFAADEGEIVSIACHPDARRQGCAAELLTEFEKKARDLGLRGIFLEVRKSNVPAICLYERNGFASVGLRPRFYRHPVEDALLLRLDLPEEKEKPC